MTAKQIKGLSAPDGSHYVTLTDGAGALAPASGGSIAAGSAVIGKVGIDQTTPGTSNLVYLQGSRPFVLKGTVPNTASSYGTLSCVGGLLTIATGLPAGSIITSASLRVKTLHSNVTTSQAMEGFFFDSNPSGSTIADNTTFVPVAADIPKLVLIANSANQNINGATAASPDVWTYTLPRLACDGSGNIYVVLAATAASLVFANANILSYEIDGTY